jgi:hypothetical protein
VQIGEIPQCFVGGEPRIQRHADRSACDCDDRDRSLWSGRQDHRNTLSPGNTEASQLAHSVLHARREPAIGNRELAGRQNCISAGRHPGIMANKIPEVRKDAASGLLAGASFLQLLTDFQKVRPSGSMMDSYLFLD